MKKILSLLLTVLMMLTLIPISAFSVSADISIWDGTVAAFENGSGTEDDPYLITNAAELAYFANSVNSGNSYEGEYIKLTTNIKLNDETFTLTDSGNVYVTDGTNSCYLKNGKIVDTETSTASSAYAGTLNSWSGIGKNSSYCFSGNFDGGNHTISNIYYTISVYPQYNYGGAKYIYGGLFGYVSNGIIKNVAVSQAYIYAYSNSGSYDGDMYVGGIAACAIGSTIENCYSTDSYLYGSSNPDMNNLSIGVGGIIGSATNTSVNKCFNNSLIKGYYSSAGGIIGAGYGTISNCYNSGTVISVDGSYDCAGGIIGYAGTQTPLSDADTTEVSNCYNIGTISGGYYSGGIIGTNKCKYNDYGTIRTGTDKVIITNCYYKLGCATYGSGTIAQGLGGTDDTDGGCKSYTASNLQKQENYVGFDFETVWRIDSAAEYPYPTLRGTPFVDPDTCVHEYKDAVTEPTCTEAGFTTHTCSNCGHNYTDSNVSANGHSYDSVVTKPTCTEDGFTTYSCSICGDTYTDNTVASKGHTPEQTASCTAPSVCTACGVTIENAKGHSYESVVTKPTCAEQGYTTYTCGDCGDSYKDSYVRANGHSPDIDATCVLDSICTVCGETVEAAKGHNYTSVVTKPTCTEQGYTTHTCGTCGDSYKDGYVAAIHTPGEAATCTTAQLCAVCEETVQAAKGHNYTSVVTKPTCTEQGYTTHTCGNCGDSYKDGYVAASHTPGEAATCTTAQICAVCEETIQSAKGHNYTSVVTKPTCAEQGYTTHTCGTCGDSYKDSYVSEKEHSAGEWTVVTEPEIGKEGLKAQYCTECGETLNSQAIPAIEDIESDTDADTDTDTDTDKDSDNDKDTDKDNTNPETEFVLGDINNNGSIDMTDYILAKRAYFGTYKLTEDEFKRGNVNFNEGMDMTDYILIKRAYFGTYTFA